MKDELNFFKALVSYLAGNLDKTGGAKRERT